MILVLYVFSTRYQKQYNRFEEMLVQLPKQTHASIIKYRRSEDRWARLLGRLLFMEGCGYFGLDGRTILEKMAYTRFSRPYIPACELDFNISHANTCIICAMSLSCRLGVDVEYVKAISIEDFYQAMLPEERARVSTARHALQMFYQYWTEKEAVLKANGKGLQLPLEGFIVRNKRATIEGVDWFLKEIPIKDGYVCNLAVDERGKELHTLVSEVFF